MLTEVLDLVNKGRAALNREPLTKLPKGLPGDVCRCVIAEAFASDFGTVNGEAIFFAGRDSRIKGGLVAKAWGTSFDDGEESVLLPEPIQDFIGAFDTGQYPELLDIERNPDKFEISGNDLVGIYWWMGPHGLSSRSFSTREKAQEDLDEFLSKLPR